MSEHCAAEEMRSFSSSKRSRDEEDCDDGLRLFKRRMFECFINFMKSDQPRHMYDSTLARASVVCLDSMDSQRCAAREGAESQDVCTTYPMEWEMCLKFIQQANDIPLRGRDSPRGRQLDEAPLFVPRVFLRHRVDPDIVWSPEQVNMRAGNGQAIEQGSCLGLFPCIREQFPGPYPVQGLIVCTQKVEPSLDVYGHIPSLDLVPNRNVSVQGDVEKIRDRETQVYDRRFILVGGMAANAEAETSKVSAPHQMAIQPMIRSRTSVKSSVVDSCWGPPVIVLSESEDDDDDDSEERSRGSIARAQKWTAAIQCDLCGRGPSLACGEWYAWCCGKPKSSCFCPPRRRIIKLAQKATKATSRPVNGYVHRMCAIWSAEVVEQNDFMQDLASAVRRGLSLKCAHCQKFGATLGCRVGKCRKSFHYPCADLLASRLQLRMWEGCSVAIACNEHQHIDSVCDGPIKLPADLRTTSNLFGYLGSNLVCEDLSNNQEAVRIPCTNDVDSEPLPQIKYITKCRYNKFGGVMRAGMCPGKAKLAIGCQGCTKFDLDDPFAPISVHLPKTRNRCSDIRTDWQQQSMSGRLAYDEFGRLQLGSETVDVVECNVRCKCGLNCKNSVLQNGLQVRLEVFRTRNRGWGVRTLDDLPRGTFVVEYVGELLTHGEADIRGQQYDAMNHSCLFNMDHPDVPQDEILVLDGYSMSNVARFINHSCDGNLVVCRVYTESTEPKFFRIGLYTNRDIWAGTELCYDYSYNAKDLPLSREDLQHVLCHPETIRCRCGSPNCRKVLWRGGS